MSLTEFANNLSPAEQQEIFAILSLLEDADETIVPDLSKKLLQYGERAIPFLAEQEYLAVLPETVLAIKKAIRLINYDLVINQYRAWLKNNNRTLLDLLLITDRLFNSEPSHEKVLTQIEKIRLDIWLELNDELTSFEQFRIINHFFFTQYSFDFEAEFKEPFALLSLENSLFNRSGSSLMITFIYQIITQKLNIPVKAYQLGNKYFLAYPNYEPDLNIGLESPMNEVMFFILPDQNGDLVPPHVFVDLMKQLRKSNISVSVEALNLIDCARFYFNTILSILPEDENYDRWRFEVVEELLRITKV